MTEELRVATMNLSAEHGDWPARREVLRAGLAKLQPDLVAFQASVMTTEHDQVAELLGEGYHLAHQGRRERDGTGSTIASRWPYDEVHEVELLVTDRVDENEFAGRSSAARVTTPLGPLLFVNHKPSWRSGLERERELQAARMARFVDVVRRGPELPVVVAGDLDAEPDATSIRFWSDQEPIGDLSVRYQDAWELCHPDEPGPTLADLDRRIDYLFVSCDDGGPQLAVSCCERLFDEPVDGVWASEHLGVAADLRLPVPG